MKAEDTVIGSAGEPSSRFRPRTLQWTNFSHLPPWPELRFQRLWGKLCPKCDQGHSRADDSAIARVRLFAYALEKGNPPVSFARDAVQTFESRRTSRASGIQRKAFQSRSHPFVADRGPGRSARVALRACFEPPDRPVDS